MSSREQSWANPGGGREHGVWRNCRKVRVQDVVRDEAVAAGRSEGRSIRSLPCQTNAFTLVKSKRQATERF